MQESGWNLKIECGDSGQMVAVADLIGSLTISHIGKIKSNLFQLLEAECDLCLRLNQITAVDSSFFQLWCSFVTACEKRQLKATLQAESPGMIVDAALNLGFKQEAFQNLKSIDNPRRSQ